MAERKFSRSLAKPGSAAQARETVRDAVRERTSAIRPHLSEPLDYETFVLKNRTILQNDPQREMLLFPPDDLSRCVIPRSIRTTMPTVPPALACAVHGDVDRSDKTATLADRGCDLPLFVRQCLQTYAADWVKVHYKYGKYGATYKELVERLADLHEHIYEVDADAEVKNANSRSEESAIIKEGYILKGPESGTDSLLALATKSFKKRYMVLKRGVDGTHIVEFYKDEKKTDSKGTLCMDFCTKVIRNARRSNKYCFELAMSEGRSCVLASESAQEQDGWIGLMTAILTSNKNALEAKKSNSTVTSPDESPPPSLNGTLNGYSLKSLEHSKNPDLVKYSRETEYTIGHARKQGRQNIFAIYPDLGTTDSAVQVSEYDRQAKPFEEQKDTRLFIRCNEIKFKLQAPLEERGQLCQVEPYITTMAIYDVRRMRKVSEDFHFDVNHPYIRNMLPKTRKNSASASGTGYSTNNNAEEATVTVAAVQTLGFKDLGEEWLAFPRQAVFSVQHTEPELYLVVRIEKVLQGSISQASENYIRVTADGDSRQGSKTQKSVRQCCQHLGHYRMPFAWTSRAIFTKFTGDLDEHNDFGPLYRQDATKLSDEDLLKMLSELRKPDKAKHMTAIPGYVKASIRIIRPEENIVNSLTSALIPVKPFPIPPEEEPTLEVQQFPTDTPSDAHPFCTYLNHLYVYPKSLKYDGQKSFAKARNLACCVELRDSDSEGATALRCVYGRPGEPLFTSRAYTAVTHHNQNPDFYEEVKIALPLLIHERHHLLFTFYHISCDTSKAGKKTKGQENPAVESVVGYSWLPLLVKDRINISSAEHALMVSANLPGGYLSCKPLGFGKGLAGPDLRPVDNGKEIYRVQLRMVSTVQSKDPFLHNFFVHCSKVFENKAASMVDIVKEQAYAESDLGREITKLIKALHAVDGHTLVCFLPTIINQLFRLLVSTGLEEVSLNTVKVLIHVVTTVFEAGKVDALHSYVQYAFTIDNEQPVSNGNQNGNARGSLVTPTGQTVHHELCRALCKMFAQENLDFLVINKFLQHSWFFFQVMAKSMALFLLNTERIKMQRQERFPKEFEEQVLQLVQALGAQIFKKCKEAKEQRDRADVRRANMALAHLLKKCLSLMNRGFAFRLVSLFLERFSPQDEIDLHALKFEFLEIICSHEHFVALNLPSLRGYYTRGHSKNSKDFESEYQLTEEFCQAHYLVGVLLVELRAALSEVLKVRQMAIKVLCNLLAKHAFDDRYQGSSQQMRIASLYLPVISLLLENINRLQQPQATSGGPPSAAIGSDLPSAASSVFASITTMDSLSMGGSSLCSSAASRRTSQILSDAGSCASSTVTLAAGGANGSENSSPEHSKRNTLVLSAQERASLRDSNYLSIIAGQASLPPFSNGLSAMSSGSQTSLESAVSAQTTSESNTLRGSGSPTHSLSAHGPGGTGGTGHVRSPSMPFAGSLGVVRYDKFDAHEVKDLLVSFLYIVKHLHEEVLIGLWQTCTDSELLDFFHLFELCLHQFKYQGKKQHRSRASATAHLKSMTLPARTHPPNFQRHSAYVKPGSAGTNWESDEGNGMYRALLEANMATEVGLITLDVLGLFCGNCKKSLLYNEGDNPLMRRLFDIYLSFLQVGQSETLLKHVFAAFRGFVNKFPQALFAGSALLCGRLCFELLRCCNSKLSSVRMEACALLYLLMRANFEYTSRRALTRVHLQLIVSVSRLLGDITNLNSARFQDSLSVINNYAAADKAMQHTIFPNQVKDLTKKVRTVLMATTAMREHENDPEMLLDLQLRLANSYSATPALRRTWLEAMSRQHERNGNLTEAAYCLIHVAALEAEFLKHQNVFPQGCHAFKDISPNVVRDESNLKEDTGTHDFPYSEESLVERLEQCASALYQAERYELMSKVFMLCIPFYERNKNYEALAQCYKTLHASCQKIIEVETSGRRLLGTYYRVMFFGEAFFGEEDQKEYIYKEPKVTSLPEISERLRHLFVEKFGSSDVVKMIMDSSQVKVSELDPKCAYIQVTHVTPYFGEQSADVEMSDFERHHNVDEFMFETPFTLTGGKARGEPHEQCRRRTVLTTEYRFPYVKKRIAVRSRKSFDLSPIEVAVDEMRTRVIELDQVIAKKPPDVKKLQLKLQGSISVQVNAGPLAYARAFLTPSAVVNQPSIEVEKLRETFDRFLTSCQAALDLNGKLISSDQMEYHQQLRRNHANVARQLIDIQQHGDNNQRPSVGGSTADSRECETSSNGSTLSSSSKRLSSEVLHFISGTPGSSTA
ncbi:dedicator of cytokinesis protein 9-like isoform X3 [Varroa destructor]|uniref:Dedicator of cytokinesis protein 9 n=1 Tax=Varroa destructor TaxID=109461 RepID=A0A7M7KXJ9_VARDE|nr:dedicator of cytokinesis protein 9-like isoform X3 [Varroa destructor]